MTEAFAPGFSWRRLLTKPTNLLRRTARDYLLALAEADPIYKPVLKLFMETMHQQIKRDQPRKKS